MTGEGPSGGLRGLWSYLTRPLYLLPPAVFLLFRLDVGGFWLWGAVAKGPWYNWGCVPYGFCETGYLEGIPGTLPSFLRGFASSLILPHVLQIEYFTLVLESFLAATILLGLFMRLATRLGVLWSLFVSGTYIFVPGSVIPDSLLFILAQLVLAMVQGGGLLTLDSALQPRLVGSTNCLARLLARGMWAPMPAGTPAGTTKAAALRPELPPDP
ncbi:MAG: hypothetical protein KGJ23_03430 [Euryarchaeota archaeon]|nr:hypothetical protein [Euryarchaeota archaeon]MDE1878999.1 hypothetical protein [Euryarchaeota archaeon]MDE2043727.1 hypothetical protein [Thermoplasmata archaeon]